jgi:hypothetical protein
MAGGRDIFDHLAAIVGPAPIPADVHDPDGAVAEERQRDAEGRELWAAQERDNYRLMEEAGADEGVDPLLIELRQAVADRDEAQRRMLRLLAYAREFVRPRPYPLSALGAAADLSASGVRKTYDQAVIDDVARRTGARPVAERRTRRDPD